MKSNQYVYPTIPFRNLTNKNTLDNFVGEKKITFDDLAKEISKVKQPVIILKGKSVEEKILNIFLDSKIIFGPKEYISKDKIIWQEKFSYFTKNNKPLQFTILGFPFKMPVSLKTSRTMPDMGEVLALARLKSLIKNIKSVYAPGAVIHIFTEGGFGPFNGVPKNDWVNYDKFLRKIIKKLGWEKELKVKMLSDMEKEKDFKKIFKSRIEENKKLFLEKDEEFMKKYAGTKDPIFKIIKSGKNSLEVLMDVYNEEISDNGLSQKAKIIRNRIKKDVDNCIIHYFAYLKTRDDLNFLEKKVPHYLALSVSPKPGRLGIIPVNNECKLLPYHGVPMFFKKKNKWSIEYLIDIRRSKNKFEKVFLVGDAEKEPFYYVAL